MDSSRANTVRIDRDDVTLAIKVHGQPTAEQAAAIEEAYAADVMGGWVLTYQDLTLEQLQALSPE